MRKRKLCSKSLWDLDRDDRRPLGTSWSAVLQADPALRATAFPQGKRGIWVEKCVLNSSFLSKMN